MNKDDMKKDLCARTTALMDAVDFLTASGREDEVVTLLDRALNIGRMTILYYNELESSLVDEVLRSVITAEKITSEKLPEVQDALCGELRNLVMPLEDIYRSRKYLLDDIPEKAMVA